MIYCSLDQALQTTGWAIFNNDKLIDYGTFKTKASDPIELRLGQIWNELNKLEEQYNFEYIFFEDIQQQKGNVDTFKRLSYVQASIILWCYWIGNIKYTILSPSHWRKIIGDKYNIKFGRNRVEQKKAAQNFIQTLYDLSVKEDEADAIALGIAGIIEYNQNRSAW